MRCCLGLPLLLYASAVHGMPWRAVGQPLASHFDLSSYLVRPGLSDVSPRTTDTGNRWTLHEVEVPPGPPDDPPRVRIRGQHVKLRIPLR